MFTSLLFLSGYVLQQQTVRSIQAAIKPQVIAPIATQSPVLAKHFGAPPGHSFYDKFLASNRPKGGWAKVGYVQILRYHVEVCNAVMQFAELERQESMAQRIIFYPKKWDQQRLSQKKPDPTLETTMRLLRSAASRYKVMLQAIDPAPGAAEGEAIVLVFHVCITNLRISNRRDVIPINWIAFSDKFQSTDPPAAFGPRPRLGSARFTVHSSHGNACSRCVRGS